MDEVRPLSGYNLSGVIHAVATRYNFVTVPTDLKEAIDKGIVFTNGTMMTEDRAIQILSLGIYNDGFLVSTFNTDDSDFVTDDLAQWATREFQLRPILTNLPRIYASQVVVDFDISLDVFVDKMEEIQKLIKTAIQKTSGKQYDLHVSRITVSGDPLDIRFPAQSTFYIEPRAGRPFDAHRYMSGAPVTTAAHLELLAAIEKLLK